MRTIILDASSFNDLQGFYETIYGMMELYDDWYPAHNLDAFNDMLYSGFGKDPVIVVWKHSDRSREDLGLEATQAFYQYKIDQGKPYNIQWAQQQLDALYAGQGQTLFDIIVEIFTAHKNIRLVLQ